MKMRHRQAYFSGFKKNQFLSLLLVFFSSLHNYIYSNFKGFEYSKINFKTCM